MKYAVITFGCRVNQADSLGFEEELRAQGAVAVAPDAADLVIVNTCSVTATADQGARQTIRRVARANPDAKIVVTGCYATRRPDEIAALPNVAHVVHNDDKPRMLRVITENQFSFSATSADSAVALLGGGVGDGPCGAVLEPGVAGRTAFTLRVQTGCAEPCSYCIIPTTRGTPRSVPLAGVLSEVERVAAAGFKEVALTGVHLGSYGRDLMPRSSLLDLLQALETVLKPDTTSVNAGFTERSIGRSVRLQPDRDPELLFRISSLEPMDCSRDIVDLVAGSECFAPHFHLPLQHASDRVLSAMRRPYTIDYYASLVNEIRAKVPSASIGSDIIAGFPGETDDDFEQLASYLEGAPLTHIHVFPYSDRPGTAASAMLAKVPGAVVRERARRLREIGQRLTQRFRDAQVGTTHRALTLEDGTLVVTGNYLKVRIPPGQPRNEWVNVAITESGATMNGTLIG
jgi:threonylcarbamoyladenosine tRNA methylthiotransferase MtaB